MIKIANQIYHEMINTNIKQKILLIHTQIFGVLLFSLGYAVSSFVYAEERKTLAWLHEIKFGVLHHDTAGLWSNFRRERGVDVNLEAIFHRIPNFSAEPYAPVFGWVSQYGG